MLDEYRIGYWLLDEKEEKMNWVKTISHVEDLKRFSIVKLDLSSIDALRSQGNINVIVHKINDLVRIMGEDAAAAQQVAAFRQYVDENPNVKVVDCFDDVTPLLNRYHMSSMIEKCSLRLHSKLFFPKFKLVDSCNILQTCYDTSESFAYPLVAKPVGAESHDLALIFNPSGFSKLKQLPCIVQQFINHNATLWKLYIIGDRCYYIARPSLMSFTKQLPKEDIIEFHTHNVSKNCGGSELNGNGPQMKPVELDFDLLLFIANTIRKEFKLDLFGVDIIICEETARYGVIDVNHFPGFKGVPLMNQKVADYLCRKASNCVSDDIALIEAGDTSLPYWLG